MTLHAQTWQPAAPPPARGWLDVGAPHPALWLARVPATAAALTPFLADLSSDERHRASALQNDPDRARTLLGRLLVRRLLAAHLGLTPAQLRLATNSRGKPFLANPPAERPAPFFNLSHSGEWVLAAFHPRHEVGVDIERIDDNHDWSDVSAHTFSTAAHAAWVALPASSRPHEFFRAWTRHEASLKAAGHGFASIAPATPPDNATTAPHTLLAVHDVAAPPGYAAACAWLANDSSDPHLPTHTR